MPETSAKSVSPSVSPVGSPVGRDWSLQLNFPKDKHGPILAACLGGHPRIRTSGPHLNVLLCALPKSASLHATQLLAMTLGLKNHQIGFNGRGGGLYYPRLLAAKFAGCGTISHCHSAPFPDVLEMIANLELRPVILTRNLLDALVSRRDMLERDRYADTLLTPGAMRHFLAADADEKLEVVMDLFAPEYMNFAAGWERLRGDPAVRPLAFTYEELMSDHVACVGRLARELGREVEPEAIRRAAREIQTAGGINFNRGVSGRGRAAFGEQHLARLRALAERIGCTDPTFLGFDADVRATA